MKVKNEDIVIPGDILSEECLKTDNKMKTIIGPGLKKIGNVIIVCNSGILRKKNPNTFWVDFYQKRYIPAKGESVLGVVTNKSSEALKLDIGGSEQAVLSFLAFEGASKKYKPEVVVGDVIYGRLLAAGSDVEPELVCIDHNFKQDRYGILKDGFVFNCSLNVVYKILNTNCPLLTILGKEIKHEIVIGMNGKVWVSAKNTEETLAIANAVLQSEFLSNSEIKSMCNNVLNCLRGMTA